MMSLVDQQRESVAVLRRYGVRRLDAFGSGATGAFRDDRSDLDCVVTFFDSSPGTYAGRVLDFAEAREGLFGRPVDLITGRSIRNPYFRQAVEATRQPVSSATSDSSPLTIDCGERSVV